MRAVLACLMIAAVPAWSQAPASPPVPAATAQQPQFEMPVGKKKYAAPRGACSDCAEVRSVKQVTKELPQTELSQQQPTGLVASVPLGGGKTQIGSSSSLGSEAVRKSTVWEVTLRYDDGRYRLMMLDKQPDFAEGDRVRVDDRGQITTP